MKERGMLFNGAMVRALLDGRKTQTRRIAKVTPDQCEDIGIFDAEHSCPYGQPGDRIWVRETWRTDASLDNRAPRDFSGWPVKYEADGEVLGHGSFFGSPDGKTRVNMHMPRWASRILLEIVSVRVERLQDISESDARSEGITINDQHKTGYCTGEYLPPSVRAYRDLWESIGGAGSWDINPWVWCINFRRIEL